MGWAWSLHFAKSANIEAYSACRFLADAPYLTGRSRAYVMKPSSEPARYCYADNLGALGLRREVIVKGLEEATSVFSS